MRYSAVNRFRRHRGRVLARKLGEIAERKGGKLLILDLGGWTSYWENVDLTNVESIVLMNKVLTPQERPDTFSSVKFQLVEGDACDLSDFDDKSMDLVHSNSLIEHVGTWPDMKRLADEALRVGRSGWMQTPAFEFPVEPHFRRPFVHWLGQPIRRMLVGSPAYLKDHSVGGRRAWIDRINLLSKAEVKALFHGNAVELYTERFLFLPKSYVVHW